MKTCKHLFHQGVVPVPNRLFDELMPELTDTELRVLLVVCRQTFGFREGSERGGWRLKERDWISHSQLCRKAGRGSEAVSRAVARLVEGGRIIIESQVGKPLDTCDKRRRYMGKLYYRLAQPMPSIDLSTIIAPPLRQRDEEGLDATKTR